MARIKPSEFNAEKRKERSQRFKTIRINGTTVNTETEPDTWRILAALKKKKISVNKSVSLNEKAEILLGAFDCAVQPEGKKYSLITTCDDAEAIENENILDPTSYEVQPEAISAKDKFTNASDPFYNLDDDIPDRYIRRDEAYAKEKKSDFVCFTAKLYRNGKNNNNAATGSMTTTTTTTAAAATTTTTTY